MKGTKMQGEQGSVAVEFAIISFLLFSIVFGIIEFGILMYNKHILTNASREGARAGVVMQPLPRVTYTEIKTTVEKYAKNYMVNFKGINTLGVSVSPPDASRGATAAGPQPPFGTQLTVTVTYPFDFLFLSGLGLDPITLTAETRMRME